MGPQFICFALLIILESEDAGAISPLGLLSSICPKAIPWLDTFYKCILYYRRVQKFTHTLLVDLKNSPSLKYTATLFKVDS